MKIRIKYLNDSIERLEKIEKGDWIDVRSAETVELKKGKHYLIPLGIAMEIPQGYEAHILPRSSSFKKWGFLETNSMGIIDNSYKGDSDWWFMSVYATRDAVINKNDRIGQFRVMEKMAPIEFEVVEVLGNENRGGHGSTGTN